MPSHPNRGSARDSRNPAPAEVLAARAAAGLTQTAAGALVHTTCRTWQQWEAGDRRMHPAFWELFMLKSHSKPAI
jgi:DNA-binding transcriptional regulator YiaG